MLKLRCGDLIFSKCDADGVYGGMVWGRVGTDRAILKIGATTYIVEKGSLWCSDLLERGAKELVQD